MFEETITQNLNYNSNSIVTNTEDIISTKSASENWIYSDTPFAKGTYTLVNTKKTILSLAGLLGFVQQILY